MSSYDALDGCMRQMQQEVRHGILDICYGR